MGTPATTAAAVHETHVSWVVVLGDRAYKLKKPVRNGFVDWRTVEARRRACLREVELNRRLAPDVYLGVAALTGMDGEPLDHLVVMRRMPDERRLSALVATAEARGCVRAVARAVASFHARAEHSPLADAAAGAASVLEAWEANHAQMLGFAGDVVDGDALERLVTLARRFVEGRAALFDERIGRGLAVDGHGDLLADDIYCLDDGPRILDCLEFDDRLRCGDVLADVAFLAMDLERLGRPDLAAALLADHGEFSGLPPEPGLAHHYVAYRAQVRTKVACLRAAQGDPEAAGEARRLLALALAHAEAARVRLVLVGGPPGTGKTTLGEALGDLEGWAVLGSDAARKDLLGGGRASPAAAGFGTGIHAPRATMRTYGLLLRRAGGLLRRGRSVVLDATWGDPRRRSAAGALARATAADLVELRCHAPLRTAVTRVRRRLAAGDRRSDATPEVARRLAAAMAPWPTAVLVDTGRGLDAALTAAAAVVERPATGAA